MGGDFSCVVHNWEFKVTNPAKVRQVGYLMVVDSAGGINVEVGIEAPFLNQMSEYAFSRRTPADVAEADE